MRLLLIDDDTLIFESLQAALAPAGYPCDWYTDPAQAVKPYRPGQYDVLLTDMPQMSGTDVLRQVRSRY
ncbi:response regulator receiver domain-containing protein [Thermodesulfitimonas autotrophica]|uniref:Stage 0 sporulation protein A homolog n=1 Tax=Thermodesulfitimonas autotrophica TaxID=1894989 RepID=A0A3N5BSS3_9THEO|nr:response regulator [Thermodesulfitimonas autotrophica]RPF46821.1 response regulator receiver domain-containing protein [Thermodesulfitimonas autotrophica]